MPFGIIGRAGPGIRQVVGFGDRSTGRGTFWANLGRAIVTNGVFTAYVCNSAETWPSSQITLGKLVVFSFTVSKSVSAILRRIRNRNSVDLRGDSSMPATVSSHCGDDEFVSGQQVQPALQTLGHVT